MSKMKLKVEKAQVNTDDKWQVLIACEDLLIHKMSSRLLKGLSFCGKGLELIHVNSKDEAKSVLTSHENIAVALLSEGVETHELGLQFVKYIREELKNRDIQLLLLTDSSANGGAILCENEINGYSLKNELTSEKLQALIYFALRSYATIEGYKSRELDLEQEIDRVELKNTMRAQMVKSISHEIKSPLNSILSALELLKVKNLSEDVLELVKIIDQSAESLMPIVNNILDFSRLENGNVVVNASVFNLSEELKLLHESYKIQNRKKDLKIEFSIAPDLPKYLLGDFNRLKQVLVNLLNNAIKFTEEGMILLKVTVQAILENSCRLKIEVSDTGVGIEESFQKIVFTPFVLTNSNGNTGTGLGLSISKNLIEMMGGQLSLESELGIGSRFTIDLEFDIAMDQEIALESVLIVDDDPIALKAMGRVVGKYAGTVVLASTVKEAEAYLDKKDYQVVVIDVEIEGVMCFELIKRVSNENCKSIVLSGYSDLETIERCKKMGVDHYLIKPFDLSVFRNLFK